MTNAKPEKKVISKLNSNAVNAGDIKFNQAIDDCMAYTDDLLRPLEEVNEDIIEDWRNPNYDLNHVISLSNKMKEAIQSVLAKHKARTGDGA